MRHDTQYLMMPTATIWNREKLFRFHIMSRPPAVVDIMWWLCLNHGCDLIKKNFRIVYANHGKNFQLTDMHFIVLTVNTTHSPPRNDKSESASTDLEVCTHVHLEYVHFTTP